MRAPAFEHLRPNPIGVYGDVLDGRGIEVDRGMLDEGEAIPDWRAYDFLVVMGAAANVWDHDEHPWIAAEQLGVDSTADLVGRAGPEMASDARVAGHSAA